MGSLAYAAAGTPLQGTPICRSARRDLDAQQLSPDEEVVAVGQLALGLEAHVGAVAAAQVGQRELSAGVFELAVRGAHVEVAGEVEIAALATDLQHRASRADRHPEGAPLE